MKNPDYSYLNRLTTGIGIYQHSELDQPSPKFGFALEDQARALIVAHQFGDRKLEEIYLNFIIKAQRKDGLLYHYFYEDSGFEDNYSPEATLASNEAYGICLWAIYQTGNQNYSPQIEKIVENLEKATQNWTAPRALAATLIGFSCLKEVKKREDWLLLIMKEHFRDSAEPGWEWFENYLVYANAILPWAMWEIYLKRNDLKARQIAQKSTDFLIKTCQKDGVPCPIGNRGWYQKGGEKTIFEQQPIEAAYMVCCLEKAYLATQNKDYFIWAEKWWNWFLGNNVNKISLITPQGTCHDGLVEGGVNKNQGAESNICFLMAYLAVKRLNNFSFSTVAKQTVVSAAP